MAGLCLVLLFQAFRMAYRDIGYDFTSYLLAARALRDGGNPYQLKMPFPYLYPLFAAFGLIPLTYVPYWLANAIWLVLCVAGLAAGCLALERGGQRRRLAVPALVALLVFFSPIQSNMIHGQINSIVLFCCVMFYCAYARNRAAPAGAWLAAAVAVKVLPAVLLLFLIVRRKYRILLWTLLFTGLLCLLPVLVAGRELPAYYRSYCDAFVWPSLTRSMPNSPTHFSLQGAVACFLPSVPLLWQKVLCGLAVAAALFAVERAAARSGDSRRDIWPFCAYLVACMLLSPVVETHHFVLAAPAVFLLGVKAFLDRAWMTPTVVLCLGGFVVCFNLAAWDGTKLSYFASLAILLALLHVAAGQPAVAASGRKT